MRSLRRRLVQLACFCLSMTVFLASSDQALAQSGGPSSDQIQMFQNLTPDQQQAILQSLGGAGGLGGGLSGQGQQNGSANRADQSRQNADNNDDGLNNRNRRPSEDDEEKEPAIPVLRADDWVIIELDFHLPTRAPPPPAAPTIPGGQLPTPQNFQAYQQAQAAQAAQAANSAQGQNPNQQGNNQSNSSSGQQIGRAHV